MQTRKIRLKLLTQVQIETIETSVRTFGELKDLISKDSALNSKVFEGGSDIVMIDRDSKVEYGKMKDAILPSGDCILIVQPNKTKSGAEISLSDLSSLSYNALRSYGSTLNKEENADIDLSGNKQAIYKRISNYLVDNTDEIREDLDADVQARIIDAKYVAIKNSMKTSMDLLEDLMSDIQDYRNPTVEEDAIIHVTEESLDKEVLELMETYGK